jgi:hypothetical protein
LHFRAINVARADASHRIGLLGGFASHGKSDASFFQRQIIRRVRKADEPHGPARLHFFDEMFRAQNHRRCAVGDLRTIADFERRRDGQVDVVVQA